MIANKLRSGSNQPTKKYTASGALSTGDLVVLNADNTVSVVVGSSQSQNLGSESSTNSSADIGDYTDACFDSNSNKVVVVFQDRNSAAGDTGTYGYACVGTVSGTSISFGTPVAFSSENTTHMTCSFDSSNNKVLVAYAVFTGTRGNCKVGTVSGTSISFGSSAWFEVNSVYNMYLSFNTSQNKFILAYSMPNAPIFTRVATISGTSVSFTSQVYPNYGSNGYNFSKGLVYDSNSNKHIIVWHEYGLSPNNTRACVGTISSSGSLSWGSQVVVTSSQIDRAMCAFDSNRNKIIITGEISSSFYGVYVIGSISGTSSTWNTPVNFWSSSIYYGDAQVVYDIQSDKYVLMFRDANSVLGYLIVGTPSGSSVSWSSTVTYSSNSPGYHSMTYDNNSNKSILHYRRGTGGGYGYGSVFTTAYTSINLTTSNFIGISNGAYADTATATIQMNRATDNAQSGLTAGATYYAQTDGTLSTTPDSPSVSVGVARTTTSIKIKGSNA